ncbi:unnamed protein product [Moneuplotes crassus]|uniref:Uncharacterized protein n=1 Tax=Euplotes crassus TaxID=5936 RepID=A0AAD1XX84_EUPCR|nr:unnamed protein product [Moneuplotes crassus]
MEDMDIWGDFTSKNNQIGTNEDSIRERLAQNEQARIRDKLENQAYRDGYEIEEDKIIESTFREGFKIGAEQWKFYSKITGKIEALKNLINMLPSSDYLKELLEKLESIFNQIPVSTTQISTPEVLRSDPSCITETFNLTQLSEEIDRIEEKLEEYLKE